MATTSVKPAFIDTNVLVYANTKQSPMHDRALAALRQLWDGGADLWISRQVLREYLAVMTRPQLFATPLPIEAAIQDIRAFQAHFRIADDGPPVTENLLMLLREVVVSGKQVHDANVVATMLTYGIEHLLTHNTIDFIRFSPYITILSLETTGPTT
jgi:toxin-antitoxin system PIN domain toxin